MHPRSVRVSERIFRNPATSFPGVPAGFCYRLALASILIIVSIPGFNSWASPAQYPKRTVNSYTIDLSPLCKWWLKHEGPRPLSAWVHITGKIVGTNAGAWIVEAQVEGAANRAQSEESANGLPRILLQNPPVDELVEFEQLSSRLNELLAQRANAAGEESQAKMHEQAVAGQQRSIKRNPLESHLLAVEDKQLKKAESTAQQQEKSLDQQIKELRAKLAGYANTDHYEVDCFALDLHYDFGRVAVYDHGRVVK